jgi:hypothetical protein
LHSTAYSSVRSSLRFRQRVNLIVLLCAGLFLSSSVSHAQRRTGSFADRPLDTSKRLYVRPSGTRVWSDPAPPRLRSYRYRDSRGRVVTRYGGTGRVATPKRKVKKRVVRRTARRAVRRR